MSMQATIVVVVVALLVPVPPPQGPPLGQGSSQWIELGSTAERVYSFDANSVRRQTNGRVIVRQMMAYRRDTPEGCAGADRGTQLLEPRADGEATKQLAYYLADVELDCRSHRFRYAQQSAHDEDHHLLERTERDPEAEWHVAAPGSLDEVLLTELCRPGGGP